MTDAPHIPVESAHPPRLIDRDKVWALFVDHYWDSLQRDRDLILCHVEAVLRMTPDAGAAQARDGGSQ